MWFLRQDPGWSDLILQGPNSQFYPGKEPKGQTKILGPASAIGPKFQKFGPKRGNLATLVTAFQKRMYLFSGT